MPTILDLNATPLPPFHFNALLAVLDGDGYDTGSRCYYVGMAADFNGRLTGEIHVSLCDRRTFQRTKSNVNLAPSILCLASSAPARPPTLGERRSDGRQDRLL